MGLFSGDLLGVVVAPVSDAAILAVGLTMTVGSLGGQWSSDLVLEGWMIAAPGLEASPSCRSSRQSRCLILPTVHIYRTGIATMGQGGGWTVEGSVVTNGLYSLFLLSVGRWKLGRIRVAPGQGR